MTQALTIVELIGVILYIGLIGVYFISGSLFIRQSIKNPEEERLKVINFVGLFLILDGISRLCHPVLFEITQMNFFYASQVTFIASIVMVLIYIERIVFPESKYAFTIILTVSEVLFVLNWLTIFYNVFSYILAFAMVASCFFIIILYIRIAIKTSGVLRRDAIFIIIGILAFALSYILYGAEDIFLTQEQLIIPTVICGFVSVPFLVKGFNLEL